MRISTLAISACAALALAACGSDTEGTFTTEDGETGAYAIDNDGDEASLTLSTPEGDVTMRTGVNVLIDLPAGFSMISGADVMSNTTFDQADTKGALVTFKSSKSPQEIADFYREQAESAGVSIQIETSMNGGKMIGGENEDNGTTFSVSAFPDDDGVVTGQLTISEQAD